MKNHQYIRQLSVKKLAEMLVHTEEVNEGDYNWNEEPCDYYVTKYYSPDGSYCADFDDAVQYTIDWLNADRKDD